MALESSDLPLISTIAVGLSFAFICGFVASKIRISPVVGYLFAGIIVGPQTPGFIASIDIAHELSEIGIILLMFGVGIHFSFRDLMAVKNIAIIGAVLQIGVTMVVGALIAYVWQWPMESGLLFGLSLSVASTVVLLRSLEQHKLQHAIHGRIAIGWLIVEDLVMILALLLIPVLAVGNAAGVVVDAAADAVASVDSVQATSVTRAVMIALFKVGLFAAVVGFVGRKILPFFLAEVNRTGSRELFTLAVLVAALGVAFGAAKFFDVSLALGAFFAGMIINGSKLNHEVASRALPFQDAFAVLFFVAIGMLFDPMVLLEQPLHVLATTFIIIGVKFLVAFVIVLLFRYPLKTAFTVSAGLAQIGEFSFILISMGLVLGVLPQEGSDLVLAGAFIAIALNPLVFLGSFRLLDRMENNPKIMSFFASRQQALADEPLDPVPTHKRRVIVIGHGRLGDQILQNINNPWLELVAIDSNRQRVDELLKNNVEAVAGDAADPGTLEKADIQQAVAVVVAVPDPYEGRRIVEAVRTAKPTVKILVRAFNDEEVEYFKGQDIDMVLLGRHEVGRRMIEYLDEIKA